MKGKVGYMKKAKIIFDKDFVVGEVDKRIAGSFIEHLGRVVYDGIYEPSHKTADELGFRKDVQREIKELGVTLLRYPGGNFVSGYDWKDGIGPRDKRPVKKNLAWNVIETNQVGTDEFAEYVKKMDIELAMAVNLGTGTPKEAGELVDYCNTKSGTYWSDLRRKNGYKDPHNIKLWYLGNEMDGPWQICRLTPEEYARKATETAKIMKWMDPDIELVVCGSCTPEIGMETYAEWDRIVLDHTYEHIDYISLHRYYSYDPSRQMFYPNKDELGDIPHFFTDLDNYIHTILSVADYIKGKKRTDKEIYISFDEWGVISSTSAQPGGVKQEFNYSTFSLLDAVIYGGILCTFLNRADRVKIACQSLLVNEGGMLSTEVNGKVIRQVTFYPFMHVAKYAKGVALKAVTDVPKLMTKNYGEESAIRTAGVYNKDTGEINIFMINCSLEDDIEVEIDLRSFGKVVSKEHILLYNEDYKIYNSFENPKSIAPIKVDLKPTDGGKVNIILKKHSWNVLRFTTE